MPFIELILPQSWHWVSGRSLSAPWSSQSITAGAWTLVYTVGAGPPIAGLSPFQWHAHEMIYGYSLAVIAGFLLTAAKNWTGIQTVNGSPLLALFGLWAAARVCMLFGTALIHSAAVLDVPVLRRTGRRIRVPGRSRRQVETGRHTDDPHAFRGGQHRILPG